MRKIECLARSCHMRARSRPSVMPDANMDAKQGLHGEYSPPYRAVFLRHTTFKKVSHSLNSISLFCIEPHYSTAIPDAMITY